MKNYSDLGQNKVKVSDYSLLDMKAAMTAYSNAESVDQGAWLKGLKHGFVRQACERLKILEKAEQVI